MPYAEANMLHILSTSSQAFALLKLKVNEMGEGGQRGRGGEVGKRLNIINISTGDVVNVVEATG